MTTHSIVELLKYKWKAKGRYGIHSPFVYSLVDVGLKGRGSAEQKIRKYFKGYRILLINTSPGNWSAQFESYLPQVTDNVMIWIHNIHQTKQHTVVWTQIYKNSSVSLSLDLYDFGLLFFNKDIKEKQHFVLKK